MLHTSAAIEAITQTLGCSDDQDDQDDQDDVGDGHTDTQKLPSIYTEGSKS